MYSVTGRTIRLLVSCVLLGVGAALLLSASLGSDGYSTLLNGLTITLGVPFVVVSVVVGAVFVGVAWLRGLKPGPGTLVQPVVVGAIVNVLLDVMTPPTALTARVVLMAVGFVIMDLGVAGYLGTRTGAGPVEGPALAFDPPIPFKWSYTVIQFACAAAGWALGAAVGVATLLVIFALGPLVDLTGRVLPFLGTPQKNADESSGGEATDESLRR